MKSLLSFSLRCLNALLWSIGLSSVVVILMLGFYLCWTQPVGQENNAVADKSSKPQIETKSLTGILDKTAVYADR